MLFCLSVVLCCLSKHHWMIKVMYICIHSLPKQSLFSKESTSRKLSDGSFRASWRALVGYSHLHVYMYIKRKQGKHNKVNTQYCGGVEQTHLVLKLMSWLYICA